MSMSLVFCRGRHGWGMCFIKQSAAVSPPYMYINDDDTWLILLVSQILFSKLKPCKYKFTPGITTKPRMAMDNYGNSRTYRGCPRGVMVKAMDCRIVVREFVLQSRYYVHFRANTLGKGMNPLILPAMG